MTLEQFAHDMQMGADQCLLTAQEMARYDRPLAMTMLLAAAACMAQASKIGQDDYRRSVEATWNDVDGSWVCK